MNEIKVYQQVYDSSAIDGPVVFRGNNKTCGNFIGHYAYEHNVGVYRMWYSEDKGRYYYDCGPTVFYTYEQIISLNSPTEQKEE